MSNGEFNVQMTKSEMLNHRLIILWGNRLIQLVFKAVMGNGGCSYC